MEHGKWKGKIFGCSVPPFLPPAFMRGEGHAAAGGVPPPQRESPLSRAAPCQVVCGQPGRGSDMPPACHSLPRLRFAYPQRGSRGSCAPFLPPAFMRGEGHEVAGGVPRGGGESLLSHGFAVPAPPEGKPRALRAVPAPRIYEGGGPRSGGGSLPRRRGRPSQSRFACQLSQGESQGSCAPFLPPGGEAEGALPSRSSVP